MGEYILIRGKVMRRENDVVDKDAPILGTVITHRSSNISTLSNSAGDFELKIPHEFVETHPCIHILSPRPGYRDYPRKVLIRRINRLHCSSGIFDLPSVKVWLNTYWCFAQKIHKANDILPQLSKTSWSPGYVNVALGITFKYSSAFNSGL